jgi:hypothetical protein
MSDSKESNPKDVIGTTKVPLSLVPGIVQAYASIAWLEGKTKYGGVNWREAGVKETVYADALLRHFYKYHDGGEWADQKTNVPHLASIIACAGIILDAQLAGKLIDDRPMSQAGLSQAIDDLSSLVEHLRQLNAEKNPKHWTVADNK